MKKYALMMASAALIAAAPAYYAFQAQAEEAAPATEAAAEVAAEVSTEVPSVDCAAIPEGTEVPVECASASEMPTAGEAPTEESPAEETPAE